MLGFREFPSAALRSVVAERGVLANPCEGKEISIEKTNDFPPISHRLINNFSVQYNYFNSYI
jgi:hypothetical protein